MLSGHGGNIYGLARQLGCAPADIIDMSSNLNPLGPLPGLLDFLREHITAITALPEVNAQTLTAQFAAAHGVAPACVLAGNGTTQFIYAIPRALGSRKALILGPTYADYADACRMHNLHHRFALAEESRDFRPDTPQIRKSLEG
ncbi:MAG: aminotransferase class I/II-fold pyridoxal phosphate-dependent enzyme, partial [Desulfobacterales bacterium]